ncbi:hypothetical protein SAMN05216519_2658 [Delftia acidovorans]|nr:hypothetical protein SAMN05216519_2658 [Delftia acidovorans]
MPSPCVGRTFGLMANATGGMPFASQPAPWQLTVENPARFVHSARPDWLRAETEKPVGSASGLEIGLALGY